jgi:dihydroorotase-like cyclic amidohydrolase
MKQNRKENKMKKYTLKEIKKLWHFAYNEDLAKEYKGFFNLLKNNIRKENKMLVKDLVKALKKCNQKSKLIFYHLKNDDLINCDYETLLEVENNRVELTIQERKIK